MKNDNFILINEVGLRDGLQGVAQEVTIEQRINIIDLLIESGIKNIQVCSFVNPRTGEILGADIMLEYVYFTNRVKYEQIYD